MILFEQDLAAQVAQWVQDQANAHQEALQTARRVDPKADRVPHPYQADEFEFQGTEQAARVYFEVYDNTLVDSVFQCKVRRYIELASNRYRTDAEHAEALQLLANLRAHAPVSYEPVPRVSES